jgi:DNA (cytosine-5)-methyltransferase 1
VEWRVVNAADYGMPQRRRRTYIVAYKEGTKLEKASSRAVADEWILKDGILAQALKCKLSEKAKKNEFEIEGDLVKVTEEFNKGQKNSPFFTAGFMSNRKVCTFDVVADYSGKKLTLGELLVDEKDVPEEFFIDEKELPKWEYLKGGKSEKRKTAEGFEYNYSEGPMAFPDFLDKPSRTIITGEGGKGPSRFKHVIKTKSGRYRRLVPIELERLNMFPDNHTLGASNLRRAFLMGNALVTGIVEDVGRVLEKWI